MAISVRTPIAYQGGKQNISGWICKHIPQHKRYIEPFAGGLAVFFARPEYKNVIEVINDKSEMVYNFWKQLRDNPSELIRILDNTLHCRRDFEACRDIFKGHAPATDMEKARAFFVVINHSFGTVGSSWGVDKDRNVLSGCTQTKLGIIKKIKARMNRVNIENADALKVIDRWDSGISFFYLDPPYPETDQGGYSGYSMDDFNRLVRKLTTIKGKFILSCYFKSGMEIPGSFRRADKKSKCTIMKVGKGSRREGDDRIETIYMNY